MHTLRHSSSRFAGSLSFHTSSTLVGLVRKGSKGAYNARFITGAATANVDVDSSDLKEPSNDKYNKIENHSKGQQTGSSLDNANTTNIQKKQGSANVQFTKAKFTGSLKGSKCFGNEVSESQADQRNNKSNGSLKIFLIACAPDEDVDTSNNLNSATQIVQMPLPNDRREENDDFSELDYPTTDLQSTKLAFRPSNNLLTNATQHVRMSVPNGRSEENHEFSELDSLSTSSQSTKLATAIEKRLSLKKEQQPSAKSEATSTEESFCKVLDSVSTSFRSIPVCKAFVNRSDFEKNTGRVENTLLPEPRFILGDDQRVAKEKKDEQAGKQKSMNQVKESNTFLDGERSVCIEYVPRGIGLFHLREALSIHGEIVGSFFQNEDTAMPTCYIEFKTIESKERALAARWIFVNGKQLSICRFDFPVTTIARITNLSSEITATTVHSLCMSYGNVESLQVRKDGSMDVRYSINELLNMPKILEMLNEVTINGSRWIAQPAPRLPKGLDKTPDCQKWAGKQLSNHISNAKKHLQLMRIYLEDMEELHNAVMHIKECPKLASNESCSAT